MINTSVKYNMLRVILLFNIEISICENKKEGMENLPEFQSHNV